MRVVCPSPEQQGCETTKTILSTHDLMTEADMWKLALIGASLAYKKFISKTKINCKILQPRTTQRIMGAHAFRIKMINYQDKSESKAPATPLGGHEDGKSTPTYSQTRSRHLRPRHS